MLVVQCCLRALDNIPVTLVLILPALLLGRKALFPLRPHLAVVAFLQRRKCFELPLLLL